MRFATPSTVNFLQYPTNMTYGSDAMTLATKTKAFGVSRLVCERKRKEHGFSLLMVAVTSAVIFGMFGLAFDVGRMFIIKNELQTFADASAIAAVRQMDGSQTGVQNAHTTAGTGPMGSTSPNRWNFDGSSVANITDTYATSFNGTYDNYATASGNASNNYRFIKVTANATLPLYFLPVIGGLPTSQLLQATATGGQEAGSSASGGGVLPFAPDAHTPMGQRRRHQLRRRCRMDASRFAAFRARVCGHRRRKQQ